MLGRYLERSVRDDADADARESVLWAATLAGIAFGNAGVHVPHAMSYAVAGLADVTGYRAQGYPSEEPLVPHGISVIVNAPSVFRATASTSPGRHLEAAALLDAPHAADAAPEDAGEVLSARLVALMRVLGLPNGIGGVGYGRQNIAALVDGTMPQARLLTNAPQPMPREVVEGLFVGALAYW